MRPSQILRPLAASLLVLAVSAAGPASGDEPDGGTTECARIAARIAKRQHFLEIREQEHHRYPSMPTFSPYCEDHSQDEDCQLLTGQRQEDLSRDISELETGPDGKTPVTDPVLVPLYRKRRQLHCPSAK